MLQDIRYALRSLRQHPVFALTAMLTLALGIGANTAIFSAVDGVLLRPLPFRQPDRVIRIWGLHPTIGRESASLPDFLDWRAQAPAFASMSALANTRFTLGGTGEPEMIRGAMVTAEFFRTLGVEPVRGRGFLPGEDTRAAPPVVVLGETLWHRRFAGDPAIVGRAIQLNGKPYTVVGIVPATARIQGPVDAWTPYAIDTVLGRRSDFLHVIGRLAPGASLDRARDELRTVARHLAQQYPESNTSWSVELLPLRDAMVGDVRPALLLFMLAVGLVLLIACANVANLMLARAVAREQEMAIRTALGASRRRLLRQLLTESVLLALAGGGLGVILAAWAVQALNAAPGLLPRAEDIGIDGRVLAFALLLSLATGLGFGLLPAARVAAGALGGGLREGGRAIAGGRGIRRIRSGLVLAEVALAFVLLVGAGLLLRSFDRLTRVEPGFRPDGLVTGRLLLPGRTYAEEPRQAAFLARAEAALAALPGVGSAAVVSDAPLGDSPPYVAVSLQGRPAPAPGVVQDVELFSATASYFGTLGIPLLEGRLFETTDRAETPLVAVVNRAMVHRYFQDRSPLGQRLTFDEPTDTAARWITVVGVVGDIHHAGLSEPPYPQLYLSVAQSPGRWMVLVARSAGRNAEALAPAMRRLVSSLDPNLALSDVSTMEQRIAAVTMWPRLSAVVLGGFAGTALLLAAIGIYGVVSYGVLQRTREVGVRMALGAGARTVLAMVLRQGMVPVAIGLVAGMIGAWAGARLLRRLLFEVGVADPLTFLTVTVFMSTTAALACYVPARRAARSDPVAALRAE
ncbi:MAG TPA: ABC transporter permease [Gemmatimonadales bacterium]|nr:ABC transporter permease [Gemmatimonadales bacterium]